MVTVLLLALAFVVAVAVVTLETWGRQPHVAPLVSRTALRDTLSLLLERGVHGTSLHIRLPDREWELVVSKVLAADNEVHFLVEAKLAAKDGSADTAASATSERQSPLDGGNQSSPVPKMIRAGPSIDEIVIALDSLAGALQSRLFPGSVARFSGDVLAFNVPEVTGRHSS